MPPTHPLSTIQDRVRIGHYRITRTAGRTAAMLGFDETDITSCVLQLTPQDFYKTMPSKTVPGSAQDVYRTEYLARSVYLKVTLGTPSRPAVIISFKQDDRSHRRAPWGNGHED